MLERHGRLELNLGGTGGSFSATTIDGHWRHVARNWGAAELAFGGTLQRAVSDSGSDVHGPRFGAPLFGHAPGRRMASGNMREHALPFTVSGTRAEIGGNGRSFRPIVYRKVYSPSRETQD